MPMNEEQIARAAGELAAAIVNDDEEVGKRAVAELVTGMIVDINRIANALEVIAGTARAG